MRDPQHSRSRSLLLLALTGRECPLRLKQEEASRGRVDHAPLQ